MERVGQFISRHALLLIVALGGVIRFATLGTQGFWLDEQVTVNLVQQGPLEMLESIPASESNPALYYLLQGGWERIFGSGEIGIRSLSALLGTATVVVVYAAARDLASRRAGLIAAALAATSPVLVWYSQEARNYSLFVFLAAVSFWCFARALGERSNRWLWSWALASALTLTTHYFAVFLFVPQLAWLVVRRVGSRVDVAAAAGVIAVVGIALLPVFATERGRGDWIRDYGLGDRLFQVPEHFLVGLQVPWEFVPVTVVALVGVLALIAVIRGGRVAWRTSVIPVSLFLAGLAMLLVAVIAGEDYVLSRNMLGLWLPFAIAIAVILAGGRLARLGTVAVAVLCAGGIALSAWIAATPEAQRPNYAELATALGPTDETRLIVSQTTFSSPLPLYLGGSHIATDEELTTSELVVIEPRPISDYAVGTCWWIHTCGGVDLSPPPRFEVPPGFELRESGSTRLFDYRVYEAPEPIEIQRPTEYFTPRVFVQTPV